MKRTVILLMAGTALTALAACGDTVGERALTGGAIGAAGGAAAGAVAGDATTGALAGGAAGAAIGALTDEDDIYLGKTPF